MKTRAVVAGIGFRHAATSEAIVALIRDALATAGMPAECLRVVATARDRADEPAIREAAYTFGLAPIGLDPSALQAVDARVPTRSERMEATRGVGSLAEAAALAAAGEGGRLVLRRVASADGAATCALAFLPEAL